MSNILEIDSMFTNLKQKVIDLESDMMEEIASLREEVERLARVNEELQKLKEFMGKSSTAMFSEYSDMKTRAEQAEKELASERGRVERVKNWVDINEKTFPNGILCFAQRIKEILD